mgnify:CR=1 FL=1|jgi:hypothetical protein
MGDINPPYIIEKEYSMPKGIIGGLYGNTGQVLSEGNIYNFNVEIVDGGIRNQQEIEFELSPEGSVKVIYGTGATKPTKAPAPKQKQKQKENISSPSKLVGKNILLTEEK